MSRHTSRSVSSSDRPLNSNIDWSDLDEQGSSQRGTASITVRLAIDYYDDVHIGSTQEASIAER